MSNLVEYAKEELTRIGAFTEEGDFYGGMTGKAVLDLIQVFADQGHSGMSANLVRNLFNRVANYEPLSPLSGADDEWMEIADGKFQNKRCPHVFKEDGQAYDSEGKIFREPNGSCYTSFESRVPVTFPYVPKHEYINVPEG